MKFVLFYHSLVSDWNHGNAHFLRGVASELVARGHVVKIYEPVNGWSRGNLVADHGHAPVREFEARFPKLRSYTYDTELIDLDTALDGADVAIVHEWNPPELIARIGRHRRTNRYTLLFHDTHHRSVTAPEEMARYDFRDYDGVLAFGEAVRQRYLDEAWCTNVWTWHEAADVRMFRPRGDMRPEGDLVWVGNWGDGERAHELAEFLIEPVRQLRLSACIHGVRYPMAALAELRRVGIDYRGWLPNWRVPETFARFRATVHVPRAPYVRALPGVPTIRVFEALACGIPLVCAPWSDAEGLFTPGADYLVAADGPDMQRKLRAVLDDPALAMDLATHGVRTIHARHTCAHRARELLDIVGSLRAPGSTWREGRQDVAYA
ncbi:MAG TPA: glycosyltransferase [Rudaea sp.]|nr:glycosyltransferase [Rudaea sp.]